jgi:hypothetical protein
MRPSTRRFAPAQDDGLKVSHGEQHRRCVSNHARRRRIADGDVGEGGAAERQAAPGEPKAMSFRRRPTLRAAVFRQRPVDSALHAYPNLPLRRELRRSTLRWGAMPPNQQRTYCATPTMGGSPQRAIPGRAGIRPAPIPLDHSPTRHGRWPCALPAGGDAPSMGVEGGVGINLPSSPFHRLMFSRGLQIEDRLRHLFS